MRDGLGDCRVSWWWDFEANARKTRLERADERVTITDELLDDLRGRGWVGEGLFMLVCDNATVGYRLLDHDDQQNTWTASRIGPDPLAKENTHA